jgi:hypothetical protein
MRRWQVGALMGFAVGYLLGVRGGDDQLALLKSSWQTISTSTEMREILSSASEIAGALMAQGRDVLADRIKSPAENGSPLKAVA